MCSSSGSTFINLGLIRKPNLGLVRGISSFPADCSSKCSVMINLPHIPILAERVPCHLSDAYKILLRNRVFLYIKAIQVTDASNNSFCMNRDIFLPLVSVSHVVKSQQASKQKC